MGFIARQVRFKFPDAYTEGHVMGKWENSVWIKSVRFGSRSAFWMGEMRNSGHDMGK